MTTQYTPILKLALPVTGELSGTWGDVVNDNITSMVEQAIAGLATISTWTGNSHTLTTANGTTSESRCAMLVAQDGAGLTAAGEIVCPASSKLYVLKNDTSYAITLKTAAGTGVAVASGNTAFLFCDGTNVNACVTTIVDGRVTGNLTVDGNATINGNTTLGNATSDTITATARFNTDLLPSTDNARDLGSTANSWKDLYIDGTAYLALVDINGGTIDGVSIGATTPATIVNVDNLSLNGNTISSTDTNGNVVIAPNGTGDVQLDADTVRVGDSGAAATLISNGAGALTVTTGGAANLTLSTNNGTNSGTIVINNGATGTIAITPDTTGDVHLVTDTVRIGDPNTDAYLTTNGTGNLNLTTNEGNNSGTIQIAQGANASISLTPNGTGTTVIKNPSISGTTTFNDGNANQVIYLNASKQATTSANLTFDGTTLTAANFADSSLTSGRVTYAGAGGNLTDSANLTFNGTDLAVAGNVTVGSTKYFGLDGNANYVPDDGVVGGAFNSGGGFRFFVTGTEKARINNTSLTLQANLLFTDNTYDIGASGANRPRTIYLSQHQYLGGNIYQNASTASNWDSNWNALQGSSGSFANLTTGQDLRIYLNGTIFGGTEKYVANGYASSMNIGANGTVWTNYASGTAGNNFSSVTGRMYFTQAGRLGVGYSVAQTPNTMISTLGGDFSVASTTSTGSANIGNLRSYSDYSGSNFELTRMEMNTKGAADDGEFAFYTRYGASLVQRLTLSVSGVVGTAFGANGITGPQYPFHGSNGSMGAADAVGWVGAAQPVSGSAYYGNGSGWLVGSITNNSARYWMGGISGHLIGGGTGGASTDESGGIAFWGKAAANASLSKTGYWDTGGLVVNTNLSVLGSTANFNNPTYTGFVMNINTGAAGNPAFGFGQVSDNPYIHMERWDGSSTFNAVRLKASNVTGGTLAFEFGTGSGRGTQSFNQKAFMNSSGSLSLSGSIIPTAATTSTYNINGVAANTWTTITSPGTLGTGAFYWVTFRWDHDGSGQPYILAGGFFFSCVNTNGSGGDNEFLPLTSSHTGAAGSYNISFRSLAGSTSNSGLQFKLNGFTGNGNLVVKYYYFASA